MIDASAWTAPLANKQGRLLVPRSSRGRQEVCGGATSLEGGAIGGFPTHRSYDLGVATNLKIVP
jgi:hypothetical protein